MKQASESGAAGRDDGTGRGYRSVRFDPAAGGPLEGIRVLDLSRLVAGNMLSLQLGDLGADVIKVEPPSGDPLRDWLEDGIPLFWKTYARNKRSIVMNLRLESARAALLKLVAVSDVLVENFRPGVIEKMGCGPDRLMAANPDLVLVRITGFGQSGPYSTLPGFGTLVEGMSGFAARNGFADREPVLPPLALADMIAGLYGAWAATSALLARERGLCRGQVIDLSLLESMFSVLGPQAALHAVTGKVPERTGSASTTSSPRNVYRCSDGQYVALSGSTEAMARRVFQVIGKAGMLDDERLRTNSGRVRNRQLVDDCVGAWFAERTRAEALAIMNEAGVTVGPIYGIDDIVADEHFRQREVIVEAEDAEHGSLPMHNIVPRLSRTPGAWRRPAPRKGEHTDAILTEAGLASDLVASLRREGAVQ